MTKIDLSNYIATYKTSFENVRNLVATERDNIENIPGVIGTGITHGIVTRGSDFQLMVFVDKTNNQLLETIPKSINGIRTIIKEVGKVEAFSFTHRVRPVRPGFSICNEKLKCAGTIGGFPIDTRHPENGRVLLSNNHVMAGRIGNEEMWELSGRPIGYKGDSILQPGGYDLGVNPDDKITQLERWVHIGGPFGSKYYTIDPDIPIKYRFNNYVDCAIAKIDPGIEINEDIFPGVGCSVKPNGWTDPIIGTFVKKAGRSTECTENYILATDVTLLVGYAQGLFRLFEQICVAGFDYKPFGWRGDSGSLIVHADYNHAIGLLFAGNMYGVVWANTIENVQIAEGVSFGQKFEAPAPQPSHKVSRWISCSPACVLERGEGDDECSCSISGEINRIYLRIGLNIISENIQKPSDCVIRVQKFNGHIFNIFSGFLMGMQETSLSCYSKGYRLPIKIYVEPGPGWILDYIKIKNDTFTDNAITIIPDDYLPGINDFILDIEVYIKELHALDKCKYQKAFLYTPLY